MKFYNLGHKTFETDFGLNCTISQSCHDLMETRLKSGRKSGPYSRNVASTLFAKMFERLPHMAGSLYTCNDLKQTVNNCSFTRDT